MVAAAAQGVAGAARPLLAHHRPFRDVRLPPQIVLDLLGQVVDDHHDAIDRRRQGAQRPVEDRPAAHRQQRLRRFQRVRAQARAQAGGENDGVHSLGFLGFVLKVARLPAPFRRLCGFAGFRQVRPLTQTMNVGPAPRFPGRGRQTAFTKPPRRGSRGGRCSVYTERQGSYASHDPAGAGSGNPRGGRRLQPRRGRLRLRRPGLRLRRRAPAALQAEAADAAGEAVAPAAFRPSRRTGAPNARQRAGLK